jgi:type I restriction enzyme S subunit
MREDWIECCFEDILDYEQPTKYIVNSTAYNDTYKMPVLTAGKSFIKGYTNETDGIFENLPTIIFDDFTTASQFVDFKFKVKSSAMKILVPTSKLVNMKFAFYAMRVNQIRSDTHKRYWISVYAKKKFLLPSLVEQKAIISKTEELFSDLDKGIDDLTKAKAQLVLYRQAVLKKAFEGELTKEWREKQIYLPPAERLLEQIKQERKKHYDQQIEDWKKAVKTWEKDDEKSLKPVKPKSLKVINSLKAEDVEKLISIPETWKYHYLAYAGDLGRGKSKHRPRNDKRLFGGSYPFFQTSEVKAQEIITEYSQTYSEFGLKQSKLWPAGTLCITIAANIAETGFLGIDACFPDSIVGYTPFDKIIDIKYIDFFFQSAKRRISAYAPATAQKNINLTTLENLLIPYCSKKEQEQVVKEIESRLSVCDKVEQSINESLEKAKALRQSILKKAFDGKLLSAAEIARCKQEQDYEPASVLLKRIKADKKKNK